MIADHPYLAVTLAMAFGRLAGMMLVLFVFVIAFPRSQDATAASDNDITGIGA